MVKLTKWEDINKSLYRRQIPPVISAKDLFVMRQLILIFSGKNQDFEAHQCFCGQIFLVKKDYLKDVKRDFLGNPICPKCAQAPEDYLDYEWRRKFELFGKLTEAMQVLERSSPEDRALAEEKVRDISKGLFEYKDLNELYQEYFKLMNELGGKEDYESGIKQEWRSLIEKLFRESKERNTTEFFKFIFSIDQNETRQIEETIWQTTLSVIRMEKDFFLSKVSDYPILLKPLSEEDLARGQLTAQLLLYCHLSELNTMYNLSMNLAIIAKGGKFKEKPFSTSVKYPWEKISLVTLGNEALGLILKEIYCKEVRNAFSHSKYKFEDGCFIKTDEDFRIGIESLQEKTRFLNGYWGFISYKIGQEQLNAMNKKEIKTKDGNTIKVELGWADKKGMDR